MDKATYEDLLKFQVELSRWKHFLRMEMETTNAPDHMVARMSVEDMIEYLLEEGKYSEQA